METFTNIAIVVIAGVVAFFVYKILRKYSHRKMIASIYSGRDLLAKWEYTSDLLRKVNEYHFDESEKLPTTVYISKNAILVTNKNNEKLISFVAMAVTNCTYNESTMLLKFRLRWSKRSDGGRSFYKDDFHIFVPPNKENEVSKVIDYFDEWKRENNELVLLNTPKENANSLLSGDIY